MKKSNIINRIVRSIAGAANHVPVEVIPGTQKPTLTGESSHYVTPSGKPVYYPNAYRRAFGKPIYVSSTLAVYVGEEYVRIIQLHGDLGVGK